ncbi:uncharacterized protein LOC121589009 [Anopheles merus]|uniref:Spaetzle domain-containing protein n=1 Tax=Anopheles merus TaxID=30066 RepID=A0A182VA74_ANOME|nr:uncharacterized protein LOC121589009 [Anopheles merus]
MKFVGWIVLTAVVLVICVGVRWSDALPARDGYPREPCCKDCPACRHHFDVEAPKDPGCRKLHNFHYDVEKFTDCHKETYDRLDAAVEDLPERGCRKSYHYHYDVQKPCCCEEENYDTYDFEVLEPKRKPKCSKVKLEAYADHPVRECQCDCRNRRYVINGVNGSRSLPDDDSDRNRIPRMRRSIMDPFQTDHRTNAPCETGAPMHFFYSTPQHGPGRANLRARRLALRRDLPHRFRANRKEFDMNGGSGFWCRCMPLERDRDGYVQSGKPEELVGAPARSQAALRGGSVEPAVYIGDASNPVTYEQIKKHLDALPREDYSPTTNDVIGNLTVLFYDIYQQKHKKNFTLPLKYGTRTVIDQGDGIHTYDIGPIEGVYKPPKLNRIATKGLRLMGRKIDRKTDPSAGQRSNRLRNRPREGA